LKAAYLKAPKKLIVQDTTEPTPRAGQVIVRVKYCGICGTDLHSYEMGMVRFVGHEFSGEVVSLGESVKGWKVGDRVAVNPKIGCGTCYFCKRGETNLCMKLQTIGESSPGAFAERVQVRADLLCKLNTMSYEEGALVEPLATPLRAVKYSVKTGDTVLVMGAGTIGLFALECSKKYGAKRVYVTEVSKLRAEAAKKLGANEVFNPKEVNVSQKLRELTNGLGPDVVLECIGKPETILAAETMVRKGGTVMIVGLCVDPVPTDYLGISVRETNVKGIDSYSVQDFEEAAKLIENKQVNVGPIITSKIGLSEIVEKGFEELLKPEKTQVKILVDPSK
jgi:(R,R)-butanediol dehydrogenase/meso-butanediol dehydrogenase/diacetyl reductase